MQDRLVRTKLKINTQFFTFPAIFCAPAWAKGYKCEPGTCGLCCLTAKPPESVPKRPIAQLGRSICAFYNVKQKLCKKHTERPPVCRAYPFLFGVENGQILISTSLECPTTSTESSIKPEVFLETFESPYFSELITLMNDCYEHAVLSQHIWRGADRIRHMLTELFKDFFSRRTGFPFLSEFRDVIVDAVASSFGIKANIPALPSITQLVSRLGGLYIATRFGSCNLCQIKVEGLKTIIVLFDEKLKPKKTVKMKTPTKSLNLEIERTARKLLEDYVALICNRPFLSMAAIACAFTRTKPRPVPIYLLRTLAGSFVPIEVSATLVANREKLGVIDQDTMREIISFCEAAMIGTFRRPEVAMIGIRR